MGTEQVRSGNVLAARPLCLSRASAGVWRLASGAWRQGGTAPLVLSFLTRALCHCAYQQDASVVELHPADISLAGAWQERPGPLHRCSQPGCVCAAAPAKGVMGRPPDLKTRALKTHDEKGKVTHE